LLLPYFNGERTPDLPHATANLSGITSLNFTPANLARASMEGATLGLRYGMAAMQENGIGGHEIRLVGGGAKSPVWRQMVADIFDMEVVTPEVSEAGALGAAIQALWCFLNQHESRTEIEALCDLFVQHRQADRHRPDPQTRRIYGEIFQRYLEVDQTLRPLNEIP
jgi:sugar (pentulose or hexulose) kinase